MKLFIKKFCPDSCYFLPLATKHCPRHLVLRHPQSMFFIYHIHNLPYLNSTFKLCPDQSGCVSKMLLISAILAIVYKVSLAIFLNILCHSIEIVRPGTCLLRREQTHNAQILSRDSIVKYHLTAAVNILLSSVSAP